MLTQRGAPNGLTIRQVAKTASAAALAAVGYGLKTAAGGKGTGKASIKRAAKVIAMAPKRQKQLKKEVQKARKKQSRVGKLETKVKNLQRVAESDMGTHIHRVRSTGRVVSAVKGMELTSYVLSSTSEIETALAQLRYYDPNTPTVLVNASGVSGSFQKEFYFRRSYGSFKCRNNYQVPCKVSLYLVRAKNDTSITALAAFTNGLTDVGNPSVTSNLVHLTDSPQFVDMYRILKSKSKILRPGQSLSIFGSFGAFQYDPSLVDNHTSSFQPGYGDMQVVVRLEGCLGHDTTVAGEQSRLAATIDIEYDTVYEIRYAAGADIKYVYVSDGSDAAFTNSGVVSNMPVSDNQAYSIP